MKEEKSKKYHCIICTKLLTTIGNECCDGCMFPKTKKVNT